ncbi:MAG: TetR/AcrR family transcriptional regulator [Acidimicrobiales bacterium]
MRPTPAPPCAPSGEDGRPPIGGRQLDAREAALTLFAERGYHGTTMNDIARALGIRAPSLYNHVRSKQDILREIMVSTTKALMAGYERATAGTDDPEAALRRAIEDFVRHHAGHHREALIGNREMSSLDEGTRAWVAAQRRAYAEGICGLIERGRARGSFDTSSPRLAAFAMLEMGVSVARWFRGDGRLSADEIAAEYAELAVRMVGGAMTDAAERGA